MSDCSGCVLQSIETVLIPLIPGCRNSISVVQDFSFYSINSQPY